MLMETLPVGPLGCNCTILADEQTRRAVVIDPGDDLHEIQKRIRLHNLTVDAILHTHTHIDHVGATAPLQKSTGAAARIHEADRFMYKMLAIQASLVGMAAPAMAEVEGDLVDNGVVHVGAIELAVMHTPGHSPGSVSFLLRSEGRDVVFVGDTLFQGSIGRTDLWGGDMKAITRSIRNRLYTLSEDTLVIPGHGPETTIGEERRGNMFVRIA